MQKLSCLLTKIVLTTDVYICENKIVDNLKFLISQRESINKFGYKVIN
ncbi:hypothetical protein VHP8226_02816 [Vibrio hippocampi]|uniref:Uncharacterized protein n=1 Tax=Vibrio hippocampi TaxID=654686 RepID=A0ABN8DJZ6_9VIBR|nr:hypothetical protein VHP8226_02816 [Vibrio hippocampi]